MIDLRTASATWLTQPSILIALDFDGTLAPFTVDPMASRPLPEASRALDLLATCDGVRLALVSGRPLDVLVDLASPPPGTICIGSHGAQIGRLDPLGNVIVTDIDLAADLETDAPDLAELTKTVDGIAERYPGTWAEHKPYSVALHTRPADRKNAKQATQEVLAGPASEHGVTVLKGKEVVEIAVSSIDKGSALMAVRDHLSQDFPIPTCFIGDDVTDESVFLRLKDVSHSLCIKVGEGDTAASYRLHDPQAVARWLSSAQAVRSQLFSA